MSAEKGRLRRKVKNGRKKMGLKNLGGDVEKMKKKVIIPIVILTVLILAFSVPAMVSSLTVAHSQSLAKQNQSASPPAYPEPLKPLDPNELDKIAPCSPSYSKPPFMQPPRDLSHYKNYTLPPCPEQNLSISQPAHSELQCPKESYNKIFELYEEAWSKDRIAEELGFPLDIVNRFLKGDYTPPSCPELDQSIQPIPKESYNKITELHEEGLSEEEIAEVLAFPLDIVNSYLKGDYTYIKTSSTYDRPLGAKEYVPPKEPLPRPTPPVEQDRLIMTQEQESPAQSNASLNPEDYDRIVLHDFLTGKIDRIPGAKDYVPPANDELLPRPTPPVEQDRLIMAQDRETSVEPKSPGITAGYQFFKGGRVGAYTDTITNLKPDVKEWQVLHQWPTSGENCIVITYDPEH